jgi:Protein kinase domain
MESGTSNTTANIRRDTRFSRGRVYIAMSNLDESAIASVEMDVDVGGEAGLHAEIAKLKQKVEELEQAMLTAKSHQDDIAIDPMSDDIEAKADASRLGLHQEVAKVLARFPPSEDKEAMEEVLRKSKTVKYAAAGSDLILTLPSLTVNKEERKIYLYDSEVRVEKDAPIEYMHGLMKKVDDAKLINNDGEMDETSLYDLVQNATDGECQKFRPRRAARSTNMIQESLDDASNCGEMFLQQVVYSPIAELFSCFKMSLYCADKQVACAHAINCRNGKGGVDWHRVGCNPDAVMKLTEDFYLIAMMELKAHRSINAEDLYRCKLMTLVSLLALVEYLEAKGLMEETEGDINPTTKNDVKRADQSKTKQMYENLAIPFVLGNHDKACLYVTRFEKVGKNYNIVFTQLTAVCFSVEQPDAVRDRSEFMSILAILVADIFMIASKVSKGMAVEFFRKDEPGRRDLPNAIGGSTGAGSKTKSDSNSTDTTNKKQKKSGGTKSNPSANEVAARNVASLHGKIQKLDYPWTRVGFYNLDATKQEQWEADMAFYMQESPFYFRGIYGSTEVFCKVWREGDPRTCRKDILEEIDFNNQANKSGVPSCKIIEDLTIMDVDSPFSPDIGGILFGSKYHVMVSEYHQNNEVAEEDVLDFAKLLVEAVLTLHGIGVVHCDIKRSNVLWDGKVKVVRLVDFGLAQKELNARSYHATRKYEAPEIGERHPHSRLSDTYCVGKTIEDVIQDDFGAPETKEVMNVAKLLQRHDVSNRLSLEKAKLMLVTVKGHLSTARTNCKRQYEGMVDSHDYSIAEDFNPIFDATFDDKNIVTETFEIEGKSVLI